MSFINPTREFNFHRLGEQWFLGEVEINEDPEELGRVRVRVPEVHGTRVDANLLPWATPLRALYRGGLQHNGYYSRPDINSRIVVSFHRGSIYSPLYFAETRSMLEPLHNLIPSDAGFDSILGEWFKITEDGEVKFHHRSGTEITITPTGTMKLEIVEDLLSHTTQKTEFDADTLWRGITPSVRWVRRVITMALVNVNVEGFT